MQGEATSRFQQAGYLHATVERQWLQVAMDCFSTVPIKLYSCIIWFLCMIFPRLIFLLHMSKAYKNSRLFSRKHQTSPHRILMMHKINLVVISRTQRAHIYTHKRITTGDSELPFVFLSLPFVSINWNKRRLLLFILNSRILTHLYLIISNELHMSTSYDSKLFNFIPMRFILLYCCII